MESWLSRREVILAPLLILVLFLLNLSIATRIPYGAWMDEVTYVDPALNYAEGKGWVSTAWPWQTDREFWAGNSPLFPAGLVVWAKVFGTSMAATRAYGHFVFTAALLLFWWGTYRLQLLGPGARLFLIVLLSTEIAMDWVGRNERYDVWIFFGLALAWLGLSLPGAWLRCLVCFLGGFIVPAAGVVGVPYIVLLAGLGVGLAGLRFWREAAATVAGAGVGVLGVGLFYASQGVLPAFQRTISMQSVIEHRYGSPLKVFLYPFDDPGPAMLILVLLLLTLLLWEDNLPTVRRWVLFGWGIVVLMPLIMVLRGVFPIIYFYMVIIPVSLAVLQLATIRPQPQWLPPVTWLALAILCFTGLPPRAYYAVTEWGFRDPQHMEDFVDQYVQQSDHAYTDYPFYYALRGRAAFVATSEYLDAIPPDEAAQINIAFVRDPASLQKLGGDWETVAVFPTPEMQQRYSNAYYSQLTYTLYRRVTTQP